MDDKRKKIIAYLHPSIYPQGILTQQYVESLPTQVRGEFYRQSIICGAALSSIDPRLVNLISGFFNGKVTAENVIKLIEQVTGYQSGSVGVDIIKATSPDVGNNINPEVKLTEKKAIENLSMLKK
ncbi:plasmid partitioning/stability family protein [Yersinia ruckeri]|uniref:plasmid partitioning/stability family protein n=1 Tax=Yersinia ruckeri TaxID=29486 RepID=UPI000537A588|nr:plasmid partitioning/stability family protein [Yersinia ruckeri]AUQ41235.1 plasmid stabilization protein [Yersinia ruckeri]WMS06811.1 plasmid partitioning/stability family protein [Yersinia ruckeri]